MIPTEELRALCAEAGIPLDAAMLEAFDQYAAYLVEVNQTMNLTAITEPRDIVVKHFFDSLLPLTIAPPAPGATLIDVGTGAGFPGVPLKIARPDLRLTLLDSLQKRLHFLGSLCERLGLEAERLHLRAEEGGRSPKLRERFDCATARAVAPLPVLAEYCLPFVRVGGVFVALKARTAREEAHAAEKAIGLLGGRLEGIHPLFLPDGSERSLVIVKKISQTPTKYPRPSGKISKNPL